MKYITFDPYYSVNQINEFMEQYQNNGFEYKKNLLISIKPPYYRFVEVRDSELPAFLKYHEATSTELFYSVRQLIPLFPSQELILQRRSADSELSISKFIEPEIFKELRRKSYGIIFKWSNEGDLQEITKKLKSKVWLLGTHRGSWKLAFSFDKGLKSFLNTSQIVLEKLSKSDYTKPGEFEVKLNQIMISDKLKNKLIEYPYWDSGKFHPLARPVPVG